MYGVSEMGSFHDERSRAPVQPQRRSFCRRYACAICTGVVLCLVLVGALLAVFVGGKAYANAAIRDADIDVDMTIMVTGANTVTATIAGTVQNHAVIGATMESSTMKVMYAGGIIGSVQFPDVSLSGGGTTDINIVSSMTINDHSAFTAFAVEALQSSTVALTMKGSISVHAAGVSFDDIDFDKTITLKGAACVLDIFLLVPRVTTTD